MSSILLRPELTSRGFRPEDGVRDMIVISDIDENGINKNLQTRYNRNLIYTFTGSILVALNPYKEVNIYEQKDVAEYSGKKLNQVEPHIFAIAEACYQHLRTSDINQSCIISGESGAGKTESTKFILQYLCSVTNHVSFWVEQQILEANTVLEAFGNAKTVRNDNSSRFGKFVQVCFDNTCQIQGCIVQDYLLEQSRLTFQSPNERNYHIFYQLVAGSEVSQELRDQFCIGPVESYDYLNQSGCCTLDGVNDSTMFDALRLAMNVLNIASQMVDGIFCVLSAILLLGNLKFEDIEGEKSELTYESKQIIFTLCDLLGFEMEGLTEVALFRQIQVRGTITSIPYKKQEASENRHAMAKALYSRTFAWLVDAINKCTIPAQNNLKFIGVLDIFGFENFHENSFEQLCINYTNEKLHMFFNHYIFTLEQELYNEEGISFDHIVFTDNAPCVDLIEKAPRCILKILDEECRFPQGTDKSYLNKQHQAVEDNPSYIKGDRRMWEEEFSIQHYAGIVTYKAQGFLEKNKDTQQDQLFDLMHNSSNVFVQDLIRFQDLLGVRLEDLGGRQTISRTNRSKPTVGDTFRHQLSALVDVLSTTNPWYVRCLKPNSKKAADTYLDSEVLTQLKYSGMLDIIRIKREGYPVHVPIENFSKKYGCLMARKMQDEDPQILVKNIINSLSLPVSECQVGKTKVFMRTSVFEPLEEMRHAYLRHNAVLIQRIWKGHVCYRDYHRMKVAAVIIQTNFRCFRYYLRFKRERRATIVIQSYFRGMVARRKIKCLREQKRREEERHRQEVIEQARAKKKKETEDELAIEDTLKESQAELESLTRMIESVWVTYNPPISPTTLNLDTMFSFLQEEKAKKDMEQSFVDEKHHALDQINEEFQALNDLLSEEAISIERQIKEMDLKSTDDDVLPPPPDVTANVDNLVNDDPLPPPPTGSDAELILASDIPVPAPVLFTNGVPPPPPPPLMNGSVPLPPPPPPPPPSFTSRLSTDSDHPEELKEMDEMISKYEAEVSNTPPLLPPPPTIPAPAPPPHILAAPPLPTAPVVPNTKLELGLDSTVVGPAAIEALSPSTENKLSTMLNDVSEENDKLASPKSVNGLTNGNVALTPVEEHGTTEGAEDDDSMYDIYEFAEKFFNDHVRDTSGIIMKSLRKRRQSTDKDVISKYEMLQYNKSGLISMSHLHLHDSENIFIACNMFKDVTRYIKEELKEESVNILIQNLVKYGIERIELRDEIFIQLVRQTNGNTDKKALVLAWFLMSICTASFSSSKNFHRYLLSYIRRNCSDGRIGKYAQMCCGHLTVTRAMSRKHPPSATEILCMKNFSSLVCKVFFMDGKTKAVSVSSVDTTTEVLQKVAEKIGLHTVEGWALYEVRAGYERYIRGHEYIADIIATWEHHDSTSVMPSKYETVSKKGHKMAIGSESTKFVFRKRVYRHIHDIPNDPVEYHLLYAEAVNKVVMDALCVSDKVALQLAGLQAQVVWGNYEEGKDFRYTEVDQYLCQRVRDLPYRDWNEEVAAAHKHYGFAKTELEAKVWYLTCVKQFPLFGCTLFPIVHKGLWSHTSDALLAINMDGIKFIRSKDKSVIHAFKYSDIESIILDPNDNYITLELRNCVELNCSQRCFMFETNHKEDVGTLIASYSPSHASWLKQESGGLKKMKMTDEEKLKLYEEIVRTRRALSECRLLQRPSYDSRASVFKTTLRKITKSKMEKLRGYSTDHNCQFNIGYWSYCKSALRQSLTAITDPHVEEMAVKMFSAILIYSGIEEAEGLETIDFVDMIQGSLQMCLDSDLLCNEFFLQLIKQTTDHPDPNSHVNKRNWQLMAVTASTVTPSNSRVQKYLQCHLRKCSLDTTTEEGTYARFCHKCLLRTTEKKKRNFPPSKKEIYCIIQRRLINECVFFPNGEHRVIEFDSASTACEVIKTIKAKIGMRSDAECFSLYEAISNSERNMASDERLSDTLTKWERLAQSAANKEFKLIFKKRLFIATYINPIDPVECHLVFHQLIDDIFEHRIPISLKDAVQLCALKIQSEVEDLKRGEIDYSSVVRILPREMRSSVRVEDVAAMHKTCQELTPHQAILSFIEVLKSWPLFGATVFEVSQSYTSALPKALLLAIHENGLYLLEHKTFKEIIFHPFTEVLHSSPAINSIMIIIGHVAKGTKFMFNTIQAYQIAHLIKDYVAELQKRSASGEQSGVPKSSTRLSGVFFDDVEVPYN